MRSLLETSPLVPVLGRCCHWLPSSCVTLQMWMSVKTPRAAAWEASVKTQLAPTSASVPRASSWPMAPCVRVSGSGVSWGARGGVQGGGNIPRREHYLLPADVDECMGEEYCAPRGECLNSHGSFFCLCAPGFASAEGGTSCQGETPAWPCPLASSRGCWRLDLVLR